MGLSKLKLALFISGRGSNMQAIANACNQPDFPAEIAVVLTNNPEASGISLAKKLGIKTEIVDHTSFDSREMFEDQIQKQLGSYAIDLIVLAGFFRILTPSFIEKWPNKIINIHPSLLPDYKGLHTHERAIADGKAEGGCTVHYVVPELDSGKIILQKRVPILHGDTPESLSARVLEQEHIAYPEAIRIVAASR